MQQQTNNDQEKAVLESRKKLSMTNVETVDGFNEQSLRLTVAGNKVTVNGQNIKITAFNKSTGNLTADGIFSEIKYNSKKTPFIKRIFK
ncbi:MAG: hypothetical protein E7347_06925 [Clostridiales bacterium]|nr:hypothetical protein [Clostridiales bacterium]